MRKIFKSRYSILISFFAFFLAASFLMRTVLLILAFGKVSVSFLDIITLYLQGFVFDAGTAVFLSLLYSCWLLLLPQRLNNSLFNRVFTTFFFSLTVLIVYFTFFAEFTFWQEFESRFNFIAVDYLVYTYEVIQNINESYPLPILISLMLLLTSMTLITFMKLKIFRKSFASNMPLKERLLATSALFLVAFFYLGAVDNDWAEYSPSRYRNELAKAGIYSFFAAFRSNELDYKAFYKQVSDSDAFAVTRNRLRESGATFDSGMFSIRRNISGSDSAKYPNVILITVESLSADFMGRFGNKEGITPVLDSLAEQSIFFTNLYATGTRTVRGMEALTLCVPPTPGSSIVRRLNNGGLFNTGTVFKKAGYDRGFFYGGDGYFDNMNKFFGGNGFDVTDRSRHSLPAEDFTAARHSISDSDVHFENAWGICDEDIYAAVVRNADGKFAAGHKFFDFIMTTSNHRPFSYPKGKIDIAPGERGGAVKYTDYAIGQFLRNIQKKPWYPNTVVVIVADHCASSAGKNEIDVSKYHIPCMILNVSGTSSKRINSMCSQVDIFPTLFGILGWKYESDFFGRNVLADNYEPRIFLGTYQKLGYMKRDSLIILSPHQKTEAYLYDSVKNKQQPASIEQSTKEAQSFYQAAYYLYKNGKMREKN